MTYFDVRIGQTSRNSSGNSPVFVNENSMKMSVVNIPITRIITTI